MALQDYLKKVDPNLALNIYTAVTNPITLEGRLRLCKAALSHKDLSASLATCRLPVFLLQVRHSQPHRCESRRTYASA